MWFENTECKDVIKDTWIEWDGGETSVDICVKLESCRRRLTQCRKEQFGNNQVELKKATDRLRRIMSRRSNLISQMEGATLKNQIKDLHHREEVYWRQFIYFLFLLE